jgi:hypothetical protein
VKKRDRKKKDEPEFEEADWGLDDGYFLAYKDGLPSPVENETDESKADADEDSDLSEFSRARLAELRELELRVSAHRRFLHLRIDFIRSQNSSSEAVAQQLAYLLKKERDLSDQRAVLHREIDQLRRATHARQPRSLDPPAG